MMDTNGCNESCDKKEEHNLTDSMSCVSQEASTLKRVRSNAGSCDGTVSEACNIEQAPNGTDCSSGDDIKFVRALRRRPWAIDYGIFDCSDGESDCDKSIQDRSSKCSLLKGVIRGCPKCDDCQKVMVRWHPDDGCRPALDEAPVFYPTEEEFADTLKYIASIRERAEPYGICRIVPPPSWKPPCPLKNHTKWQNTKFPTRVQQINKLQVRQPKNKKRRNDDGNRRKRRRQSRKVRSRSHHTTEVEEECLASDEDSKFGFDSGSDFTLERFEKYAADFKDQYFGISEMKTNQSCSMIDDSITKWQPTVENIEGEYWRVVERPTEEIEVLYGADVESGIFGSGFPKFLGQMDAKDTDPYALSGWNLNNFPRLPRSLLSYEGSDISGVLVPWIYLGMCFSSFCWHVEDHHFYSLNYMHFGSPKVWYGVPGTAAVQLEQAMRKCLPDLFEEQPDLLHKLVTQLSPSILKAEGVPVFRSVQHAGEFVLTFPRAYHAGFNCGFNCAEAVNVAPVDWLPHGQNAVELYREQCRRTSVSHDKLLLGASREAAKSLWESTVLKRSNPAKSHWQSYCLEEGILTKSLKTRVEMERGRRAFLAKHLKTMKMDNDFDSKSERECFLCFYDLHLSAVGCECCPERFSCLVHAKKICACPWNKKFLLYRNSIDELELLARTLEGNQTSLFRWATMQFGLAFPGLNAQEGLESKAISFDSKSQSQRSDIKVLLGESRTSFTNMLNLACGMSNVMSQTFQLKDGKLLGSEVSSNLVSGNLQSSCSKVVNTDSLISSVRSDVNAEGVGCPANQLPNRHSFNPQQTLNGSLRGYGFGMASQKEASDGNKSFYPNVIGAKTPTQGPVQVNSHAETMVNRLDTDPKSSLFQLNKFNEDKSTRATSKLNQNIHWNSIPQIVNGNSQENMKHGILSSPVKATKYSDYIILSDDEDIDVKNNSPQAGFRDTGSDQKVDEKNKQGELRSCSTYSNMPRKDASHGLANDKLNFTEPAKAPIKCKDQEFQPNPFDFIKRPNFSSGNSADSSSTPVFRNDLSQFHASMSTEGHTSKGAKVVQSASYGTDSCGNNSMSAKLPFSLPESNTLNESAGKSVVKGPNIPPSSEVNVNKSSELPQPAFMLNPGVANSVGTIPSRGPRVARAVRLQRGTFEIELLDVGVLRPFKSWYNNLAIFPKGFKSRVKYYDVLDPVKVCHYVSEVLDASLVGPVFKVTVEGRLMDSFVGTSVDECWKLILDRLNKEIIKCRALGKQNLPPLQPPGSLNGLEMFGFNSPSVIQAIEALDSKHQCVEYWAARNTRSNGVGDTSFQKHDVNVNLEIKKGSNCGFSNLVDATDNLTGAPFSLQKDDSSPQNSSADKTYTVLRGLFKRASPDELRTMRNVLSSDIGSSSWKAASKALEDQIKNL